MGVGIPTFTRQTDSNRIYRLSAVRAKASRFLTPEQMANPTGFSVPCSELMSISDISGPRKVSSSSNTTSVLSMEEKKTKSHGGAAGSASVLTEHCPAPSNMMTEQNVQSLPTDRPLAVGTSQVSIRSSADRLSDFNEARAVWEAAEAKLAYVRAQKALSSGSLTGSVGRRLDDVRSDAGSSGPSRPTREQARDSPFAGIYSPPLTPTTLLLRRFTKHSRIRKERIFWITFFHVKLRR